MAEWSYKGLEPFLIFNESEKGKELDVLKDFLKIETKKEANIVSLLSINQSLGKPTPTEMLALGLIAKNKVDWLRSEIERKSTKIKQKQIIQKSM